MRSAEFSSVSLKLDPELDPAAARDAALAFAPSECPGPGYARNVSQPVSPEILARVKENFEWWNGGEPQLMLDEYAEDGELDLSAVFTDMPVIRGHEGMRRQLDEFWKAWEGVRMDALEVFSVGRERFVVDVRLWGKGRRSGAEVDQRFACLYTLRESDNKIVRCQFFPTVEAATDFAARTASAAQSH
jgi:ketosteroid isomerase-like protein